MFLAPKRPAFWRVPRRERNAPPALTGMRDVCTSAPSVAASPQSNIFGPFPSPTVWEILAENRRMLFLTFKRRPPMAGSTLKDLIRGAVPLARVIFDDPRKRRLIPQL